MPTKTKTKRKSLARIKKLSTLLALGLRDLRKQELAKNSVVEMKRTWLQRNGKCVACLAGSVMRFSMGCRGKCVDPCGDISSTRERYRLYALNQLRRGFVVNAAHLIQVDTSLATRDIPDYDGPNGEWWAAIRQLLADLKEAGE